MDKEIPKLKCIAKLKLMALTFLLILFQSDISCGVAEETEKVYAGEITALDLISDISHENKREIEEQESNTSLTTVHDQATDESKAIGESKPPEKKLTKKKKKPMGVREEFFAELMLFLKALIFHIHLISTIMTFGPIIPILFAVQTFVIHRNLAN